MSTAVLELTPIRRVSVVEFATRPPARSTQVAFSGKPGAGLPAGMSVAMNNAETALIISLNGTPHSEIPLHDLTTP
jgi:hypothetical protein